MRHYFKSWKKYRMLNYFVWVKGLRGPEAQLWSEKQVNGAGKDKAPLSIRELQPFEKDIPLDGLKVMFPYAA